MNLKNLMVDTKSAWIAYPGLDGFEVEITNLGRERLATLRKSCTELKFDKKRFGTHQGVEQINEKKFVRAFTNETIRNWRGLKLAYLEDLMLVDISSEDPNKELPYTQDNAELLVSNSTEFDTWLNEVVHDLNNFRSGGNGTSVGTSDEVAE